MAKDNGGGNSPPVREKGDAPHITRLLGEEIEKKTSFSTWSSPEKFARYLKDQSSEDCWYNGNVWRDLDRDFAGVDTMAEALDLAYNGWKEGGEIIEKARGYIQALNPLFLKNVRYDIAGTHPNVPRAVAGNVLNMHVRDKDKSNKRKTITIVYNMCEAWFADKDKICNKAAVTAALIDEIEAKGYSVEVIACAATGNYKMRCVTSVLVKESHQPVDLNRLAFSLGHSAMFRAMFFGDWQCDDFNEQLGYGLGIVSSTQPSKEANERNIFTITSGVNTRININLFETVEKAASEGLAKIVSELQRQGCPAFPKKDHEDDLDEETTVPEPEEDYYDEDEW